MTDLEKARLSLENHSICLCKGEKVLFDDSRGIAPMMKFIAEGRDLKGWSAADVIVGKAAAMLFVKAGVKAVHGKVMSKKARDYLLLHSLECSCETECEKIINREGTDICPMEKAVDETEDFEEAYLILKEKTEQMRRKNETH